MVDRDVPPIALTIAGSDSSGGAGLQADLRAFAALGVHGACAVTLVSSQNTAEFRIAVPMPPGMVLSQIEAVLADMAVGACKTGLLFTESNIAAVATIAEGARLANLVVDPVLVGMGGRPLYDPEAEQLFVERLVPCARVLTPNHLEAGRLLGRELDDDDEALVDAARELRARGADVVVITGGRRSVTASEPRVRDVVVGDGHVDFLDGPWIDTPNVRGSGDSFSAAICARLAHGDDLLDAVAVAHRFTASAVAGAARWRFGAGQGPVDHFGWSGGPGGSDASGGPGRG